MEGFLPWGYGEEGGWTQGPGQWQMGLQRFHGHVRSREGRRTLHAAARGRTGLFSRTEWTPRHCEAGFTLTESRGGVTPGSQERMWLDLNICEAFQGTETQFSGMGILCLGPLMKSFVWVGACSHGNRLRWGLAVRPSEALLVLYIRKGHMMLSLHFWP